MVYCSILNIVPYIVGSSCLSILYVIVYICLSQTPNPSLTSLPLGHPTSILYVCESVSVL